MRTGKLEVLVARD
jgi:sideroflexin-5